MNFQYRPLCQEELTLALLRSFERKQVVTKCWRKCKGSWQLQDDPFIDDWSLAERQQIIADLRNTLALQGAVYGAFDGQALKGFVSIEGGRLGSARQYMDLSHLYVSQELRHSGIGRQLFRLAVQFARQNGAAKLYLSAHSAAESQAFYRAMGCVEAEEYDAAHVEKEPYDCQLEYRL